MNGASGRRLGLSARLAVLAALAGVVVLVAAAGAGARSATDPRMDLVGQSVGNSEGVAVQGTTAYVGDEHGGLRMVDVSDPAMPRELGNNTDPGGRVASTSITVAGQYAYLGDIAYVRNGMRGDLRVVDVGDPTHPVQVAVIGPGSISGLAAVGGYLYAGTDSPDERINFPGRVRVFSLADPAHPAELPSVGTATPASGVAVEGRYLYVAERAGLTVFDLADPARPALVSRFSPPRGVAGVAVRNGVAYLTDLYSLQTVSVCSPAAPTSLGQVAIGPQIGLNYVYNVAVNPPYALVTDGGLLQLVDVGDPARPMVAASSYAARNPFRGVTIAGAYGYIAVPGRSEGGLFVFRLSGATPPSLPTPAVVRAFLPFARQNC